MYNLCSKGYPQCHITGDLAAGFATYLIKLATHISIIHHSFNPRANLVKPLNICEV